MNSHLNQIVGGACSKNSLNVLINPISQSINFFSTTKYRSIVFLLFLTGLKSSMTKFGRSVNKFDVNFFKSWPFRLSVQRFSDCDYSFFRPHNRTLQKTLICSNTHSSSFCQREKSIGTCWGVQKSIRTSCRMHKSIQENEKSPCNKTFS